jgi:hypothetical protein
MYLAENFMVDTLLVPRKMALPTILCCVAFIFVMTLILLGIWEALPCACRKPPRNVPYKCTYVPYDGTFGASNQGQMLDV